MPIRDFYTRTIEDPKFLGEKVEVSDEIESAVQQTKMTLFTRKGEVLGEPDFGLDFDKYLFEYDFDPAELINDATLQVNKYVGESKKRQFTISPSIYSDPVANRDILVLLIDIPEIKSSFALFYD
jgi:hypothetical protein